MFRNRLFLEWLGALLFSCLVAWWTSISPLGDRLDFQLQDIATSLVGGDRNPDIVLVTIDDESLAREGRWPWPRDQQARLIDRISAARPRAIIYDVLLLEPSTPEADAKLARSIAKAGNVLLPHSFVAAHDVPNGIEPALPIAPFADGAAAIGHVALDFESDGAVRRIELIKPALDNRYEHLTIASYRRINGRAPANLSQLDSVARPIVPFRKVHSYPEIHAASIVAGETPEGFLRDKIVFVGATAQGLGDTYPVPAMAGGAMSGVEIQANLFDRLSAGKLIRRVSTPLITGSSILLVILLFLGFRALRPNQLLGFTVGIAVLVIGAALLLPRLAGIWFPPGAAVAAIAVSYPLWGWRRLASVVDFLARESTNLRNIGETDRVEAVGFDEVDRQANRMESLVALVRDRFQFIRSIIRDLPDPIVVFDQDGRSILFNERAKLLFGEAETGLTYPDLIGASKGRVIPATGELRTADQRIYTVERAKLELSSEDAPAQIVQFHDVTAIRDAERERNEMLEFLSHDMRAPQVAIIAMVDDGQSGGKGDERLQRIRLQAQRTLKLADDFVQIARMVQTPLKREEFDLAGLAQEAADRAHFMARRAQVELLRTVPDEPAYALGDPALVARVIDNLLNNALKFSPPGSRVVLSVGRIENDPARVWLQIEDEGPGLPPERALDPFRRFGARDTAAGPSAGLGLAFVAEAARKHEAELTVESAPGEGACFRLVFAAA